MTHADHQPQLPRLRRIEGQVRGIERDILDTHVAGCVAAAAASGDTAVQRAKTADLTELLRRAIR